MSPQQVPLVSSKQAFAAFARLGFEKRPTRGSHCTIVRARPDGGVDVAVLVEGKREIPRGTLRSALAQAKVSVEEFCEALHG